MALISFLLPTRKRPSLVNRFLQSVLDHTKNLEYIEIVLYIDEDDTESHGIENNRLKLKKIIGPRDAMGRSLASSMKKSDGSVIILANDDMVIRTHGWDTTVLELDSKIKDKVYLAYANDLIMRETMCSFPIVSKKLLELLVVPFPPEYKGGFLDYHFLDIFKRLEKLGYKRLFYFDDIIFEHLHYQVGKADLDSTYQWRGPMDIGDDVFTALRPFRQTQALRLRATIEGNEPPEIKRVQSIQNTHNSFLKDILNSFTKFAMDSDLPGKWRTDLFMLFITRAFSRMGLLPGKGYMRKFLKPAGIRRVPWARKD